MISVTLSQPYPWCLERGLLAVLPIGRSLGDPLVREWRKSYEKRRVAIRSSASSIDHAFIKAMKRRMKPDDFEALWMAVLEIPLGAVVGSALAGCAFVGDSINNGGALIDIQKGTVCVSLTEFEALPEPVFVAGPDGHLAVAEWGGTGVGMTAPTTQKQGTLF